MPQKKSAPFIKLIRKRGNSRNAEASYNLERRGMIPVDGHRLFFKCALALVRKASAEQEIGFFTSGSLQQDTSSVWA